eukprot:GCRY01000591.1.p1 GENE.GCRY01000591.1~~GCRY01000591.1.p1  ORF type:complete len:783 (+),score=159.53 GCRY01000591.1:323-2671(+)
MDTVSCWNCFVGDHPSYLYNTLTSGGCNSYYSHDVLEDSSMGWGGFSSSCPTSRASSPVDLTGSNTFLDVPSNHNGLDSAAFDHPFPENSINFDDGDCRQRMNALNRAGEGEFGQAETFNGLNFPAFRGEEHGFFTFNNSTEALPFKQENLSFEDISESNQHNVHTIAPSAFDHSKNIDFACFDESSNMSTTSTSTTDSPVEEMAVKTPAPRPAQSPAHELTQSPHLKKEFNLLKRSFDLPEMPEIDSLPLSKLNAPVSPSASVATPQGFREQSCSTMTLPPLVGCDNSPNQNAALTSGEIPHQIFNNIPQFDKHGRIQLFISGLPNKDETCYDASKKVAFTMFELVGALPLSHHEDLRKLYQQGERLTASFYLFSGATKQPLTNVDNPGERLLVEEESAERREYLRSIQGRGRKPTFYLTDPACFLTSEIDEHGRFSFRFAVMKISGEKGFIFAIDVNHSLVAPWRSQPILIKTYRNSPAYKRPGMANGTPRTRPSSASSNSSSGSFAAAYKSHSHSLATTSPAPHTQAANARAYAAAHVAAIEKGAAEFSSAHRMPCVTFNETTATKESTFISENERLEYHSSSGASKKRKKESFDKEHKRMKLESSLRSVGSSDTLDTTTSSLPSLPPTPTHLKLDRCGEESGEGMLSFQQQLQYSNANPTLLAPEPVRSSYPGDQHILCSNGQNDSSASEGMALDSFSQPQSQPHIHDHECVCLGQPMCMRRTGSSSTALAPAATTTVTSHIHHRNGPTTIATTTHSSGTNSQGYPMRLKFTNMVFKA